MLVSTAIYALVCKTRGFARYKLLIPAVVMLVIVTTNVCLSMYTIFGLLIGGRKIPSSLVRTKHTLYLFNKYVHNSSILTLSIVVN